MIVGIFTRAVAEATMQPSSSRFDRGRAANCKLKLLFWLLTPMLLYCPSTAPAANNNTPANSADTILKPLESPMNYSVVLYKPGNRRDPFINPLLMNKKVKQSDDEEVSRGLPPAGIKGTYIAQATLQGIAIRENGRIAVFRGADTRAYFLHKGDRLFDGYVKEIFDDSVTLVRETRFRSGRTLSQEVTKRLRTP